MCYWRSLAGMVVTIGLEEYHGGILYQRKEWVGANDPGKGSYIGVNREMKYALPLFPDVANASIRHRGLPG